MNPLTALKKKKKKQKTKATAIWDSNKDVVATRYYSSEFLGKSSANDLYSYLEQCLGPSEKEKLLHISSDRHLMWIYFFSKLVQKSTRMKNLVN